MPNALAIKVEVQNVVKAFGLTATSTTPEPIVAAKLTIAVVFILGIAFFKAAAIVRPIIESV